MRTIIYGAAVSLDGYIAGPNGEVDWLQWNDEVAEISKETWSRVDTVLMGRNTYDAAVRAGMRAYPGVRNIVFSSTLPASAAAEVTVVAEDAVPFVQRLKQEPGADICVIGGGQLARSLLDAGLIDEIGVNVQPVVLGSGIPLLPPGQRDKLDLIKSRVLEGPGVYLLYRVVRESPDGSR